MTDFPNTLDRASTGRAQFDAAVYGALGDGATDDTAALQRAINTAVTAGMANGSYYGEVLLDASRTYVLSSPTTKSTTNKGNAQLYLPVIPTTGPKFTLVIRGTRSSAALPHWQQTSVQAVGAVLKTTLTGLAVDGTYGPPSVIGGPTFAQGYGRTGVFSNMLIVIDGVNIQAPANPSIMGFDFEGLAEMHVVSASANASVTPGSGWPTLPTHDWAYGLYTPAMLNNDLCDVQQFSCEGFYAGAALCEHAAITTIRCIYCVVGLLLVGNASNSTWIGYASVELCNYPIQSAPIFGGTGTSVVIDVLDIEDDGTAGPFAKVATVDDAGNALRGVIHVHELTPAGVQGGDPTVNGAANLKLVNLGTPPGASNVPALPASTVASTPVYRDAYVVVTGGTVTAASVDGAVQGFSATGFGLFVPAGKTFALTYSVAPTIKVTLL